MVRSGSAAADAARFLGFSPIFRAVAPIFRAAALSACLTFAPCPAFAEAEDTPPVVGDDDEVMVITATRLPTELGRVGSSISVISAQDLAEQQTRFVTDVLQTTPGLSVSQFGPRGTGSTVRLRGQGAEGTLVLIDGIEVSDPSRVQTAFDFSQALAGNIDQIEVLRGSQSVLYGGDAVGGVVNILTRRGRGPATGSLLTEYGRFDSFLAAGSLEGGLMEDRFGYSLNLQYFDTEGFSAADENLPGNGEGEDYDNLSSSGRFDAALTDWIALKAAYRYAAGTLNFDRCGGPDCDDPDRGDDFLQYAGRVAVAVTALNGALTAQLGAAYTRNERDGFNDGASSGFFEGERTKIDFEGRYTVNPDHAVVFGVETEEERSVTDSDPGGADVRISGYYALYQGTFADALTLSFGARIDDHELFGTFETYRVTAAYGLATGTKLKGSFATGFRAPSLFELFGVCCGDPNLGNPDLQPEESESWDIGVEQTLFGGAVRAEAVYFQIETDNEIIFDFTDFGGPSPNYINVPGTTTTNGVESVLSWQAAPTLDIDLAYTFTETETEAGARLDNRPRHIFNLNTNWAFLGDRGQLNLNLRHFADTVDNGASVDLENPVIVNLALRYALLERLELSARIENLLNDQYQTEFGYGTADISAFGGIRVLF